MGTRGYPSYYGGFETAVRHIAPHLADLGWSVTVYGRPHSVQLEHPKRDYRILSVLTRGLETKSLSTLSYGLTAALDILREKPDVVLAMNVANGLFLPFFRIRGIPVVVNVDGVEWARAKWGLIARTTFRLGAWCTAKFANRIVVDAQAIGEVWSSKYGKKGVFIPYGGELASGDDSPPLGLSSGSYVLFVARFVPENSTEEFFDAVSEISSRWSVVIVGSGGGRRGFEARAAALEANHPAVHWLGHISDDNLLHRLWRHAGVYFHGHSVGGTNPTLVQAMAEGAPVVARDTIFNREVLGEHGRFVAPDPHLIYLEIRRLMEDGRKREAISRSLKARARDYYSWDSVSNAYDSILNSVLANGC